ncbi:MAG TPA: alginate lyase family protein [Lacunisphaera sp.]
MKLPFLPVAERVSVWPHAKSAKRSRVRLLLASLIPALAVAASAAEPYYLNQAQLADLATKAPAALKAPITTVVDKTQLAPTGDVHDYISYARYYWPDPKKPDGLPYVSIDGKHNHEQVARGDRNRIDKFANAVTALAAAWRLQHDEAAARRAGEWLRAWYITPATRMNPNLEYAQVRLGHSGNHGNASGMLDTRAFADVIDGLLILEDSPALTPAEQTTVRAWFADYLKWFTSAKIALEEHAAKNNHGSWYLAQVIPMARYAGREDLARQLCEEDKARIAAQIQPDGRQPLEIARVDGLGYSRFNLEAQAVIARHARALGIDLWNYTAPNGASLRQALDFLRPYNQAPEKWPTSQNEKLPKGFLDELIAEAAAAKPAN